MRIVFIADWRSPTAKNWVGAMAGLGYECLVISSFPVDPAGASETVDGTRSRAVQVCSLPIALAGARRARRPSITESSGPGRPGREYSAMPSTAMPATVMSAMARSAVMRGALGAVSNRVAHYDLRRHLVRAESQIAEFQPDLVHALRIPYEGMFAALLRTRLPLVVSVWGNDFTLFAPATRKLGLLTRTTMRRAAGVIADCHVDLIRATAWGMSSDRPTAVLPGGGGIDLGWVDHAPTRAEARALLGIDPASVVVLNPRGSRSYVRTTEYCRALQIVARQQRDAVFVFADMADNRRITRTIGQLGLGDRTILLPKLSHSQMIEVFAAADVSVSPSLHDGTPNTLLESMAAGCLPVSGDIPSVREWINPGINGLVCDPLDPADMARAVLSAINDPALARMAVAHNRALVRERASRRYVAGAADAYYRRLLAGGRRPALT